MSRFGEAVRIAREARGWTQQELAAAAKVSQRAVSSWEKGVSEPPDTTKWKVADALPLPTDALPPTGSARRMRAGGALLAELPLEELEPGEFENFAVSLAEAHFGGHAQRLGISGHKQEGFDVLVEHDQQITVGIQCKRASRFGPAQVRLAVQAATTPVPEAIIFLSRAASPAALAEMRKHRGWQLWDRNKISHVVHELPPGLSVPLVDRYFPQLRERFLGVPLPGPWLDPDQYFAHSGERESSNHRWTLVGRSDTLDELTGFATNNSGKIGVLVGRGGIGKSKILYELVRRLKRHEITVRFLERDPVIDHRAFDQVPPDRVLVVVDDAHDADAPVGKVVRGVLTANPQATILLSLRPDGEARARRQLREAGYDPLPEAHWQLKDLKVPEAEDLARQVLGAGHDVAATRLALAARDCPFLLVTGAALVRDRKVDLERIEGDEGLRRELIESLADTISTRDGNRSESREQVLYAVAALQPLRTADSDFRVALEQLANQPFDQLAPHLAAWQDTGIVLSRGESYRIVPDLLGDALLARAARTRQTGAPTGYLERVHRAAGGQALAHLIVNASRIDWQEPPSRRGRLVATLWAALEAQFRAGDADTRVAVLQVLENIAFYQPRPTIALVRWALDHPAEPTRAESLGMSYTIADQQVRDAAVRVLRTVAYDIDMLAEATDLLWQIARGDARPPHQHPDHALRMLAELAAYDPRGVSVFQATLPALAERWLRRGRQPGDVHDPLTVLHPLLATEGHRETWQGDALIFHPFLINPQAPVVADLRGQVLDLAFSQLTCGDARRAAVAVETIAMGVTGPRGGFGLEVTEEQRNAWTPQFTATLERLRAAIGSAPPPPAVAVALRARLQWHTDHAASDLCQAARAVIAALPRAPEYELARALHGGPTDPPTDPAATRDYRDREAELARFHVDCARALAALGDQDLVALIETQIGRLSEALGEQSGRARTFLWALVRERPSVGVALCERAIGMPDSPVVTLVSIALIALGTLGDPRVITLSRRLLETGNLPLARETAHALGIQRSRTSVLDGESELLRELVRHNDPGGVVPAAALGAARLLASEHRNLAVDLLTAVPAARKVLALGELAWCFGPHGALAWRDLARQHREDFLAALRAAPSIEDYQVAEFLAWLSLTDPGDVLQVLTARIQAVEDGAKIGEYAALPFHWPVALRFRERDDFPDQLRRVREWLAAQPGSMWRRHLGADLFAAVAGLYDAQTRRVIEEYLTEPNEVRIKTVATMLHGAPPDLVWDLEFVRGVLCAADSVSAEALAGVQGALYSAMITDPRGNLPGARQRDAAAALAAQAPRGSVEGQFYDALTRAADDWIARDTRVDAPPADGRHW